MISSINTAKEQIGFIALYITLIIFNTYTFSSYTELPLPFKSLGSVFIINIIDYLYYLKVILLFTKTN